MQINHLPENIECFKVFENKAYFEVEGVVRCYQFENVRETETWKNKRSLQNRKSKTFEYFMACDDLGMLDYLKLYKIHGSIGVLPPDPYCLAMLYAYDEHLGIDRDYNEEDDTISEMLRTNQAKKCPVARKQPTAFVVTNERKHRLKQLCDASNLPIHMAELFVTEIKLSTDDANKHLRERLKLLGLN